MHASRQARQTFRTSDGLNLHYVVDDYTDPWRPARTVLLVHAAMGSSRRFYAWVPHLARDFRVVRFDLRGHGDSDAPGPDQLSFLRLVQDVAELLDHLKIERVDIAGSSAGGIVAQRFAMDRPHRVDTLGTFAATPGMKHGLADYKGWVRNITEKGVARFLRETIADRMDVSAVGEGFVDWFTTESARTPVHVLERFVPMMRAVDLTPDLPRLACPVLCVVPGADPIHTVDEYRVIEQAVPDCEFIVYEGLQHNITDAVPDRCARDLHRFLLAHGDKQ